MRNAVTVTQTFPTWAAAYEARERLAQDDGLDRYGIDRVDIERLGGAFDLLIRTDEFHRDEIEHLLRSSGTSFNPPAPMESRRWHAGAPLMVLGTAAIAGLAFYTLLGRGRGRRVNDTVPPFRSEAAKAPRPLETTSTPMFTLAVEGTPIAVTKGNESEARAVFEKAEFKSKLRMMESDGKPLWNGTDGFRIRPASGSEIRALVQYAETLGLEDEEEGDIILYLMPIDTPDEFDETQDG